MKNVEEMTLQEILKLAEERQKEADFKNLLKQKGFNEKDLIPQLVKRALINNEKTIFNVQFLEERFEYEGKEEPVRKVLFNKNFLLRNEKKYLPENFVADLKRIGIKDFVLCGEVPVRLIKEFEEKGCRLQGLFTGTGKEKVAQTARFFGNAVAKIMEAKGPQNDGFADGLIADFSRVQSLIEPGLHFTIE